MKKLTFTVVAIAAMLCAGGCSSIHKTATELAVSTEIVSYNEADLEVSPNKVTYFYKPSKSEKRGGNKNAISCAVAEALKANGNADVMVAPQYIVKKKRGKVKEVTVTGYPATYKNFHKPACKK